MLAEHCKKSTDSGVGGARDDAESTKRPGDLRGARVILVSGDLNDPCQPVAAWAQTLHRALGFELRWIQPLSDFEREGFEERLRQEAAHPDVALVILQGLSKNPQEASDRRGQSLLLHFPCPVLSARPTGPAPAIVAATDCSSSFVPVIREACVLAVALGRKLTLVHNVPPEKFQYEECIRLLNSLQLVDMLAQRVREQLKQPEIESEVVLTREADEAQAVLKVVRAKQADLLLVGVKPSELDLHRTADALLKDAPYSALFIPLGAARKSMLLD